MNKCGQAGGKETSCLSTITVLQWFSMSPCALHQSLGGGIGGLPAPFLPGVLSLSGHPTVLPPLGLTLVYPSATLPTLSSVQIFHVFFFPPTKHKLA